MNQQRPTLDDLREEAMQMEDPQARQNALDALDGIEKGRKTLEWSRERTNTRKLRKVGETRGGARPGAGRPTIDGEKATVQIAFRLTPSDATALLEQWGKEGDSIHKVCMRLARQAVPKS